MPVQFKVVQRVVGFLLSLFSVTMLTPVGIALLYRDGAALPFLGAFAATLVTGLVMYLPVRRVDVPLKLRDGFVVVVAFWAVLWVVSKAVVEPAVYSAAYWVAVHKAALRAEV